jgi:hypothetical protein
MLISELEKFDKLIQLLSLLVQAAYIFTDKVFSPFKTTKSANLTCFDSFA